MINHLNISFHLCRYVHVYIDWFVVYGIRGTSGLNITSFLLATCRRMISFSIPWLRVCRVTHSLLHSLWCDVMWDCCCIYVRCTETVMMNSGVLYFIIIKFYYRCRKIRRILHLTLLKTSFFEPSSCS